MSHQPGARNTAVDVVRGLAILVMIPANMAAGVYAEPHALWFRILSSFAAPLFIAVSGMMIGMGRVSRTPSAKRHLARGAMLLGVAAMLDVLVWQLVPFVAFDVLYLLGFGCLIVYFFTRLPQGWQYAGVAALLTVTPLAQSVFGYSLPPVDIQFAGTPDPAMGTVPATPVSILRHWFVDGWFPLFPWLAVMCGGAMCGQVLVREGAERGYAVLGQAGVVLTLVGSCLWWWFPGPHVVRAGYSEMFYPPTVGFILAAFGSTLLLFHLIYRDAGSHVYAPLRWLGEASLAMYILHFVLLRWVISPAFPAKPLPLFLLVNAGTTLLLIAIAWGVHHSKRRFPQRPSVVRFLLGG